jgi:glycosyltransferase involved in cell wall biosynthesis
MGGIEVHITDLGRGLMRRGWDVALVCSTLAEIDPLRQAMVSLGAEVHAEPEATNPLQMIHRAWRLFRVLRRYTGAVVHLHLQGESGGLLVLLAARAAMASAVIRTLHNPPVPPISRRHRMMVGVADGFVDKVICVSPETRRAHLAEFKLDPQKYVTISNGVDLNRFSPLVAMSDVRRELGIAPEHRLIGTIARLQEERKGISDFIEMAAVVAPRWPQARFLVVGDGPLRANLEAQAARLRLTDRILFTGYRDDVPMLLASMEIAVFPSSYEAAQYVMLEAMAMALPVVTTPAGLAKDIVETGINGLLIPLHDIAAMSRAVDQLLTDPKMARQIGAAAREMVVKDYSTEVMVDAVGHLYAQLTAGHPRYGILESPRIPSIRDGSGAMTPPASRTPSQ